MDPVKCHRVRAVMKDSQPVPEDVQRMHGVNTDITHGLITCERLQQIEKHITQTGGRNGEDCIYLHCCSYQLDSMVLLQSF